MQRRFEGTRVTVESFLAWKARFDVEMGAKKIQDREDKETRKLTGRELFLTDKTLIESDLKFLEDGKYLYLIECCSPLPPPPHTHTHTHTHTQIRITQNVGQNNNIKIDRHSGTALLNENDMKKSMAD